MGLSVKPFRKIYLEKNCLTFVTKNSQTLIDLKFWPPHPVAASSNVKPFLKKNG